jgi:hypothetical protein
MKRSWASLIVVVPLALFSLGACGGSAFDAGPGSGGTGAASGTAGSSVGGTIGISGGTSSGGSTSVGGSLSVGGSSSGGQVGVAGSGGSGGTDITACSSNTDCEIEDVGCCSCGQGPVSNFTAINSKYDAQYSQRCGAVDCAACPPVAFNINDPTRYYVPTCAAGHCTVVDLRATDITVCSSASDCSLRNGTACCDGCSGPPIALNTKNEPELSKYVCGNEPVACAACVGSGSGYTAACSDGRCSVASTPCTAQQPCPL